MSAPVTVSQDKATKDGFVGSEKDGFAGPVRPTDQTGSVIRRTDSLDTLPELPERVQRTQEHSLKRTLRVWDSKIREGKASAIADPANPSLQLAEGTSVRGTARADKNSFEGRVLRTGASGRLTGATPEAIRRLASQLGQHADPANPSLRFHDQRVQRLASTSLQADERWGFAGSKREQLWQAEVTDPATRLVVAFATGVRDEELMEQVLQDAVSRLCYPQGIVLFTDGEPSYKRL